MKKIDLMAPAKINLTLKVGKKQPDGFHPIESIMQTISLFDYVSIEAKEGQGKIQISGTSDEIPYDERNIAHKAAVAFLNETKLLLDINIYIEKNIPVCAGLAGGSTDAAAVIYGLNKLNDNVLSDKQVQKICGMLGSDLNFCLIGGRCMCRGKGDDIEKLEFEPFSLTLVKPKNLKISAKEAYTRFDETKEKSDMPNDLEHALLPYYSQLKYLNAMGLQMSGSGPTYFSLEKLKHEISKEDYLIIENLHAIEHGIKVKE